MKRNCIILLLLFSVTAIDAQVEEDTKHDTIFSNHDDKRSKTHRFRKVKTRYGLVDFGINTLLAPMNYSLQNGIDPFELRLLKSTNFNLHLIQQRVNLARRNVNFIYGLSFESHRYSFDNPVVLLEDTPEVEFDFFEDRRFKKNRLAYTYLTIPMMINFKSNPRFSYRSFHLSAGGFAGLLLGANFKTKEKGNKDKVKDNFAINTFQYGLRGEIGYGPLIFYTTYNLNHLFDEDKDSGYEVTPLSIGLVIWPF